MEREPKSVPVSLQEEQVSGVDGGSLVESGEPSPQIIAMPPEDGKVVLADEPDKVKFIPHEASQNGEAKVEMDDGKVVFAGMGKEELMKYAEDPFWVRMRWSLFVLFWVLWVGMLAGAIVIIVLAPRCEAPAPRDWWQRDAVYEINPRSFVASKGDVNGDLAGIISKVNYLKSLGAKTILLESIYKSPLLDMGYDVEDYMEVNEVYGSMKDLEDLLNKLHENEMKLVLDFVPNHSSNKHIWFQKSVKGEAPYADYYVWAPKTGEENGIPLPPNNWVSKYGDSAWEWNEVRQAFYLHQFDKVEPDLNYRNPKVVEEMEKILKFWLDKGVDGFRLTDVAYLLEDESLENEAPSPIGNFNSDEYNYYVHNCTYNQPGILDILVHFREVLDSYETESGKDHRVLMTEAYLPVEEAMMYYGNSSRPISDLPLNFGLVRDLKKGFQAQDVLDIISSWLDNMPKLAWASWMVGSRNDHRVASRFSPDLTDAFNIIITLLPGTSVTYYGEEIGMTDTYVTFDETKDLAGKNAGRENYQEHSRDPARTPMQWNSAGPSAGFSIISKPWLPVNSDYKHINVELQEEAARSHLSVYRLLTAARNSDALLYGDLEMKVLNGTNVFAFTRVKMGTQCYLAAINFGEEAVTADFTVFKHVPKDATEYVRSVDYKPDDLNSKLQTNEVSIGPLNAIVMTFAPQV